MKVVVKFMMNDIVGAEGDIWWFRRLFNVEQLIAHNALQGWVDVYVHSQKLRPYWDGQLS